MKRMLEDLTQWLGLLFLIAAAARAACLVFLPGNPAGLVAIGLMGALAAALGVVCLIRLVLWLLRGRK